MFATAEQMNLDLGEHGVYFYRGDADLAATVGAYLTDALVESKLALVIATPAHFRSFEDVLVAAGIDVERAREDGRLIFLDALAMVPRLTVAGQIDARAFDREIGSVLRAAAAGEDRCCVQAYGELVDLLWQAGDVPGAIKLETLWDDLVSSLRFSLLCGYHSLAVARPEHERALDEVCRLHSRASSCRDAGVIALEVPQEVSREFSPETDAPHAARRFLEDALRAMGHSERLIEDARLLISELVTNAVVHARAPMSVSIRSQGSRVRLLVHDMSPAQPSPRPTSLDAPSGRGLQLIAALARDWGVTTSPTGKTVWADL